MKSKSALGYSFLILLVTLVSCDWAKQKTKATVNKTGEVVAKAGSEFADGVSKGVEKTFQNEIVLSEKLKKQKLEVGKVIINSSDSSADNILTTYIIFGHDFDENLVIRVVNDEGREYGRVTQNIKGKNGEAKYIDFVFDKRTNIDGKGKLIFE